MNQELFYLRGGINYAKLSKFDGRLLKIVGKAIAMENPNDKAMIQLFVTGGSFMNKKQLKPMIDYIKERKKKMSDLDCFIEAQDNMYSVALKEIKSGKKRVIGCGIFFHK